jgi:thioesterase domain-containing protein
MTTVIARKPTKKAFYFPTSGDVKRAQRKAAAKAEAAETIVTPPVQAEELESVKTAKAVKAVKATKKAAKSTKATRAQEAARSKAKNAKKEKVVRDSFTMPKADHERIATLKRKCLDAGITVKKSELLRAGIQLLDSASSKRLLAAISALETVKTGRPAKGE